LKHTFVKFTPFPLFFVWQIKELQQKITNNFFVKHADDLICVLTTDIYSPINDWLGNLATEKTRAHFFQFEIYFDTWEEIIFVLVWSMFIQWLISLLSWEHVRPFLRSTKPNKIIIKYCLWLIINHNFFHTHLYLEFWYGQQVEYNQTFIKYK
jgi:hypothetical protein